jgi:uncharacterized protein YjbI with pentapeptide repeats
MKVLLIKLNVEQINAALGLNIFILLCHISQEAKIPFWPCGNPASFSEFQPEALANLIARTAILQKNAFARRCLSKSLMAINLPEIDLPHVMLSGANLSQINLSDANLIGANLTGANLTGANLAEANLTGANLTGANLAGANLTGANLTGANLTRIKLNSTNLTNACLFDAILGENDRETAIHSGAMFSLEEFRSLKQLLSSQFPLSISNFTSNTDIWFQTTPEIGLIESVEGEPIIPVDLFGSDDGYVDDETVFGEN